jgi:hypothetical protein
MKAQGHLVEAEESNQTDESALPKLNPFEIPKLLMEREA